ncbi:hypothetical protein V500_02670 [Pseudogymnoascus sp. VKM F-4518 (FW-2643)]|nr:hypothetical protein V500_02670 [Pseudogymnoascus sp. VKM F-4518 (FW-2643)]
MLFSKRVPDNQQSLLALDVVESQDDYAITFDREGTDISLASTGHPPRLRTQATIKFADQVKRSDGIEDDQLGIPDKKDAETHIAFLGRQRNRNDGVLRIPGPRDADRGVAPETIDYDAPRSPSLNRCDSGLDSITEGHDGGGKKNGHMCPLPEVDTPRRGSTVDDLLGSQGKLEHAPESAQAAAHTLDALRSRKPRTAPNDEPEDDPNLTKTKSRVMSLSTMRDRFTRDKESMDPMPYIGFHPTVGRNSAFVDLSEDQREELGGIEYRSLKSLALILVCYYWGYMSLAFVGLVP